MFTSTTDRVQLAAANHTSKNTTEFGSMIAPRSPFPTPRAVREPAREQIGPCVEVDDHVVVDVLDEGRLLGGRGDRRADRHPTLEHPWASAMLVSLDTRTGVSSA